MMDSDPHSRVSSINGRIRPSQPSKSPPQHVFEKSKTFRDESTKSAESCRNMNLMRQVLKIRQFAAVENLEHKERAYAEMAKRLDDTEALSTQAANDLSQKEKIIQEQKKDNRRK